MTKNPIVFRIWYPRVADQQDFQVLRRQLKRISAQQVLIFDNSYMDNFQFSDEVLQNHAATLTKRIAELAQDGIEAGINSGATIGHGGIRGFAEAWHELRDLQWWTDADGSEAIGIACPIGAKFHSYLRLYFRSLAKTGARIIFIDDDMRPFDHGPAKSDLGCLCDVHLERFNREHNFSYDRQRLCEELTKPITAEPSKVQIAWQNQRKQSYLQMCELIRQAVDSVDPSIRLGLMPVQNLCLPFGADFFNELLAVVSGPHRPLLRDHDFHGLPRMVHPGSALYVKSVVPARTEHMVEIENNGHNFHDFKRSPRQTRYAVLTSLATGIGGASINALADQPGFLDWEERLLDMFAENCEFFKTVAEICSKGTVQRGVPIRHFACNRNVQALDYSQGSVSARLWDLSSRPEMVLTPLGIPYEFSDDAPALLIGSTPRFMGKRAVEKLLSRGAVLDVDAAQQITDMGLGDLLSVKIAEPLCSYAGNMFNDPALCGPYAGRSVPLRRIYRIHRLEYDPRIYKEATSIIRAHQAERIAAGVLVRCDGRSRIAITPYPLRAFQDHPRDESGIIANSFHRYLLVKLFEWVQGSELPVWIDGPPHLAPYYLHRPADDAVILSLFNADPDEYYDFDVVLGSGQELSAKSISRVDDDGQITPCPDLQMRCEDDGYRLRIPRQYAMRPTDVSVFLFN